MVIEFDFKKEKLFLVKSMSKAEDHIGGQVDGQNATTSVHIATKREEEEYYRLLAKSMSFTPSVLSKN